MDEEGEEEEEESMDECKTCGKPAGQCTCESTNEAGLTSEDLDEIIAELENEVADEEEGRREEEPVAPSPVEEPAPAPEDDGEVPPVAGDEEEPVAEPVAEPKADVDVEPGSEVDINLGPEAVRKPVLFLQRVWMQVAWKNQPQFQLVEKKMMKKISILKNYSPL